MKVSVYHRFARSHTMRLATDPISVKLPATVLMNDCSAHSPQPHHITSHHITSHHITSQHITTQHNTAQRSTTPSHHTSHKSTQLNSNPNPQTKRSVRTSMSQPALGSASSGMDGPNNSTSGTFDTVFEPITINTAVHHHTTHHSTVEHSTGQHSTAQHSTAQHGTAHNTTQQQHIIKPIK